MEFRNKNILPAKDWLDDGKEPRGHDCLVRIKSSYPILNAAEKKAADFILANPESVLDMTISEVASESGVSESTVFKLCRSIEYKGFRDLKITLARQYREPESISIADEAVIKTDSAESIAKKAFGFAINSLSDSLKSLDFREMQRACDALKKARKVLVASLGISRTTSIFAADKLSFFGINAVAATDVHVQAMQAAILTPKDALLAFSRSGDTRDIIETVQIAKRNGATTIGVTNNPRSYFAKLIDIRIFVESKDAQWRWDVLASRIEHFCVVDTIYIMLAARNQRHAKIYLEKVQKAAAIKQY